MRIEREHNGRPTYGPRRVEQPLHDPRVASMDTVEITDRDGAVAQLVGKSVKTSQEFHIQSNNVQGSLRQSLKRDG